MTAVYKYGHFDHLRVELPEHWEEKALKFISLPHSQAFVDGPFGSDLKSGEYVGAGIPLIQLSNIRDGHHVLRNMKFITEEKMTSLSRHIARPGDLVFAKMAEPVARTALVSAAFQEYVIVADCVKMSADDHLVDTAFLVWAINSDCVRIAAELVSSGTTRIRISLGEIKRLRVPFPPIEEQTQIAKFLDYETAKIDALIEKQQQLIALLKEKRLAVISHAVTKGLNPDAPMRDSGVDCLGEVPAHWDTSRLKFLVSHVVDCHHSTPGYDPDAAFPALRTADVTPGHLDVDGARRVHLDEYKERISRLQPKPGDIVYSREGERWGIAAPVPEGADVCLAQRVMLFRANELVESDFLMWALNSIGVYNQLAVDVVGATSPHVNIGDIREVWVAVPPLAEQAEIVSQIQRVLQKLDGLDRQCSQVITMLQERRTALISAAVTGKIDVRGWKAPEAEAAVA